MLESTQKLKDIADNYYRAGNYSQAFSTYKEAITLEPLPSLYNNASACLIQLCDYPQSLYYTHLLFTSCSSISPSDRLRAHERAATSLHLLSTNPSFSTVQTSQDSLTALSNFSSPKLTYTAFTNHLNHISTIDLINLSLKHVDKGLIESSSPTLSKLKKLLLSLKSQHLINPELSNSLRLQGNELVSKKLYKEAITKYTEALKHNNKDYRIFSNRALCFSKLMAWSSAISDCENCIKYQPDDYIKGVIRLSKIYTFLKIFHRAVQVLNKFLSKNNNKIVEEEKMRVMMEVRKYNMMKDDEGENKERMERSKGDGEVEKMVKDGKVQMWMKVMNEGGGQGEGVRMLSEDKDLREKVEYLNAAGIIKMG